MCDYRTCDVCLDGITDAWERIASARVDARERIARSSYADSPGAIAAGVALARYMESVLRASGGES